MPHSKGFAHRKDERTLKATRIGDVVDGLLLERAFARGMPIGQLASDWASVVGPRLAAESAPVSLERGVLVVAATTGPWGAQVRFLSANEPRWRSAPVASPRCRWSCAPTRGKACSARRSWACAEPRMVSRNAFGVTLDW
jgi:hypothetical protein